MMTFALERMNHGEYFWIAPLIFFGLIVLFWVFAARRWRRHGWAHHGQWKSAGMRILEERYANGEIDRDEFFARKKDLEPPAEN